MAEMLYARDVYGKTLVEIGKQNSNVVVLDADLSGSTRTRLFANVFPDRFFNCGVAEQNMMATAAGLASCGKVAFVSTFAMFAAGRAWDQVRNTICYGNLDVKIVASHAGITVGPDGASHQALEDIAIMRVIPTMRVLVPCDGPQTRQAVLTAFQTPGPFYIRLGRAKVETVEKDEPFVIGRGRILAEGTDVTVVACGILVHQALEAAKVLKKENISVCVINMPSVKPIDSSLLIEQAKKTKGFVVCEEHSVTGGLASAVAEVVCEEYPVKILKVGVKNRFGQSGDEADLLKEYQLLSSDIVAAVKALLL